MRRGSSRRHAPQFAGHHLLHRSDFQTYSGASMAACVQLRRQRLSGGRQWIYRGDRGTLSEELGQNLVVRVDASDPWIDWMGNLRKVTALPAPPMIRFNRHVNSLSLWLG